MSKKSKKQAAAKLQQSVADKQATEERRAEFKRANKQRGKVVKGADARDGGTVRSNSPARSAGAARSYSAARTTGTARTYQRLAPAVNLLYVRIAALVVAVLALAGGIYWVISANGNMGTGMIIGLVVLGFLAGLGLFIAARTEDVVNRVVSALRSR